MADKPDYDLMPAGREMDAMVAEKVMGWKRCHTSAKIPPDPLLEIWVSGIADDNKYINPRYVSTWDPSTSISAAMKVADKMGCESYLNKWPLDEGGFIFGVIFIAPCDGGEFSKYCAVADTLPLAICRAALKAVSND